MFADRALLPTNPTHGNPRTHDTETWQQALIVCTHFNVLRVENAQGHQIYSLITEIKNDLVRAGHTLKTSKI